MPQLINSKRNGQACAESSPSDNDETEVEFQNWTGCWWLYGC